MSRKSINTLVADIYGLFDNPPKLDDTEVEELGRELANHVVGSLKAREETPSLRFSNIGTPCKRKLWYSVRAPQLAEKLPAHVRIKFLFGNLLESILLFFAKASGHEVGGRQGTLSIAGIEGHRDAVIDGRTIDVKSATTNSFKKFKDNGLGSDDPFGYIDQINAYRYAAADDPEVDQSKVSFLAIDKQLGHVCLDTYEANDVDYEAKINELKELVAGDSPPPRHYSDEPFGASGNRKLGTNCSYCPFKSSCWPGLRTFVYSNGPVHLTHVAQEPKVMEARNDNVF